MNASHIYSSARFKQLTVSGLNILYSVPRINILGGPNKCEVRVAIPTQLSADVEGPESPRWGLRAQLLGQVAAVRGLRL